MRWPFVVLVLCGGCTQAPNHLGNPLWLPVSGISNAIDNQAYAQRRGTVELTVKSGFTTIISDIRAGGGPALTQVMDQARVPMQDRPTRILQLQSDIALYQNAPGALVTALMVYGS